MTESFNKFGKMADALLPALSAVVRKTAFDLQSDAAQNAPVDSGFLKGSIYVVTSTDSTYGSGGTSGPGDSYLLPQVDAPSKSTVAYVGVGANYGIYVEEGTRFMPAQPYFYPAAETAQEEFAVVLAAVVAQIEKL
jgi:HK97 gp10 family phage protein